MAEQVVTLKIGATGTAQVVKSGEKVKKSWIDSAAKIGVAWIGLSSMFKTVSKAMTAMLGPPLQEAAKFVKSENQIRTVLGELGKDVEKGTKKLADFAMQQSINSEFSANEILNLSRLSLTMTKNTEKTEDMTKAAMVLNKVFGFDLETSMGHLTKTFAGLKGELGEKVIAIRGLTQEQLKHGEAVDVIIEQYGGLLASNLDTVEGKLNNVGTVMQDLYQVEIGKAVMGNAALAAGLDEVVKVLIEAKPNGEALEETVKKLAIAVVDATKKLVFFAAATIKTLSKVGRFALSIASIFSDGMEERAFELEKFESDVEDFAVNAGMAFTKISNRIDNTATKVKRNFKGMRKSIQRNFTEEIKKAKDAAKAFETTQKRLAKWADIISGKLKKVAGIIEKLDNKIQSNLNEMFDKNLETRIRVLNNMAKLADVQNEEAKEARRSKQAGSDARGDVVTGFLRTAGGKMFSFVKDMIQIFFDALKDPSTLTTLIDNVIGMIENILTNLSNPDTLKTIINGIMKLVTAVIDMLASSNFISDIVSAVVNLVLKLVETIFPQIVPIIQNIIGTLLDNLVPFILGVLNTIFKSDFISQIFDLVLMVIMKLITEVIANIGNIIGTIIEGVTKFAVDFLKALFTKLIPMLPVILINLVKAIGIAIADLFKSIWNATLGRLFGKKFETSAQKDARKAQEAKEDVLYKGLSNAEIGVYERMNPEEKTAFEQIRAGGGFMHGGGPVVAHNGLGPREVPAILEQGEAVVPNGRRGSYQGFSTDNKGNIRGGSNSNVTINISALDAKSFEHALKGPLGEKLIFYIVEGMKRKRTDVFGRTYAEGLG